MPRRRKKTAEKEYIEREAAINAFEYADYDVVAKYGDDGFSFDTVERIIRNIPATDVRPVVLCRDCKNRFNIDVCKYRGDDWFCGYGERKREES